MIKDITLGQYFPGSSIIHRLDPRVKLILVVVYMVILFMAQNLISLLICLLFSLMLYPIAHIPLKMAWKNISSILPILLFTAIINLFFVDGVVLWSWKFITITERGVMMAVLMLIRISSLLSGTALLTYTTSPIALTDGMERLFAPLNKLHFPVHEISMMMTIALRFIPTLIDETDKIMSAQKARGADMESGNFLQRMKAMVPILVPLFVSAFRRADDLALAMESRCYHGGEGRTRMRQMKITSVDLIASLVVILLCVVIFVCNSTISLFTI